MHSMAHVSLSGFIMFKRRMGRQRANTVGGKFHISSGTRGKGVKAHSRQGLWVPAVTETVESSSHCHNTGPSAELWAVQAYT